MTLAAMTGSPAAAYAMVVFLLLATAFAQVAFKDFHHSRRRASLLVAIGLFAACPLLTILASRQLGIGKVYVFMSLAYGLVAYLGWKRFGERVTRAQLQGIALITLGCILYAF